MVNLRVDAREYGLSDIIDKAEEINKATQDVVSRGPNSITKLTHLIALAADTVNFIAGNKYYLNDEFIDAIDHLLSNLRAY